MIHRIVDIYERWSKCLKEALVPDLPELGITGLLSVSFAGWFELLSMEALHLVSVVVSAVAGAVALHISRHYLNKWLPPKKDK